jgi:pimeloyl-ACP methyl ester carboxylesterase
MKQMILCGLFLFLVVSASAFAETSIKIKPYEFKADDGSTIAAEKGELTVPENRALKNSRKIVLSFVRFKSTKPEQKYPVIYLAGGPGGSGIGAARGTRLPLFLAMREFGDVIALDQRGTGISEPDLNCKETYSIPLDQPLDAAIAGRIMASEAKKCFDHYRADGIDLSAYNTRENAADLNDLRIALGASKIRLWGISYGTHLALATMKYYGQFVDRAILGGVEPLNHTYKLPSDQQRLMEKIAALANENPKIHAEVPDLLRSVDRLLKELDHAPKTVSLTHPITGKTANVVVGKFDLQTALTDMLEGPDSFSGMADFIHRLEQGDWISLALVSGARRNGTLSSAMSIAMDCASGGSSEWSLRIRKEAVVNLLGDAINFPFPYICEGLGVADMGDSFRTPFKSEIPVLLISGTLDGRTPPSNAEDVAATFPNAQHLILEGAGHSDPLFLSSDKITAAVKTFMSDQKIVETRIEVPFTKMAEPRKAIELPLEKLDRFTGTYQIDKNQSRRVFRSGSMLYTQRGTNTPMPIRPMSETSFFYEGTGSWVTFDLDSEGKVISMTVYQAGGKGTARKVAK